MGISVKTEGLKLIDQWLSRYKDKGLSKKEVKEVGRLLVVSISADSRWVKVERSKINTYTNGTHPKGDFEPLKFQYPENAKVTNLIKCDKGTYFIQATSEYGVVRGWHPDLLNQIKDAGIKLPQEVASSLFDCGQSIINDRKKLYRE